MTGRRTLWGSAVLLCCCTSQVSFGADWKSFPYGILHDDLVKIEEVCVDQLRVLNADGSESQCKERDLKEIGDLTFAVNTTTLSIERALSDVRNSCEMLRGQLAAEFDDGYLEMMVVVLATREKRAGGDSLYSVMQESRERRLQELVSGCKAFDEERVVALHRRCDFTDAFIEAAADQSERKLVALGREKTWIDAQAQVQSGDELQTTRKKSADLGRAMQELGELAKMLRAKKNNVAKAKETADALYDTYVQTYEKATQFLGAYAAVCEQMVSGMQIGDVGERVALTGCDWAKEMLQPGTLKATGTAASALALLDSRRNPPKLKPPKKESGCFIATAVYGSYEHPDVLTLRRFRDDRLFPFAAGRCFIGWYYRHGPVAAEWLNTRPVLKPFFRVPLCAAVWMLRHPVLLLGGCTALLALLRRRRARRGISEFNKEGDHAPAI